MLGGHARTMETSAPFTPVDLPGQRAPWLQRRPAWSAEPESPLLAGGDSPVLGSASLGRSAAGGALRVRHGVVSRPVKRWPAAADDVLDCHRSVSRCAATDKLTAARAAADRASAKVYQVLSHGGTSTVEPWLSTLSTLSIDPVDRTVDHCRPSVDHPPVDPLSTTVDHCRPKVDSHNACPLSIDLCRPLSTAVDCRLAVDCQPLSTCRPCRPWSTVDPCQPRTGQQHLPSFPPAESSHSKGVPLPKGVPSKVLPSCNHSSNKEVTKGEHEEEPSTSTQPAIISTCIAVMMAGCVLVPDSSQAMHPSRPAGAAHKHYTSTQPAIIPARRGPSSSSSATNDICTAMHERHRVEFAGPLACNGFFPFQRLCRKAHSQPSSL